MCDAGFTEIKKILTNIFIIQERDMGIYTDIAIDRNTGIDREINIGIDIETDTDI